MGGVGWMRLVSKPDDVVMVLQPYLQHLLWGCDYNVVFLKFKVEGRTTGEIQG